MTIKKARNDSERAGNDTPARHCEAQSAEAISCYNGAMTGEEAGNDTPPCHCEALRAEAIPRFKM